MNQRGFTLIEFLIAIAAAGVIGVVVFQFGSQGFENWRLSSARAQTQEQARRALDSMSALLREIRAGDNGAYAIVQAQATSFTGYANVDADDDVEQVQFVLNGTTLERRVIEPSGQPVGYTGAPAVISVVPNVRALTFEYFDTNYSGTQAALAQPVNISTIRLVRLSVTVDDDPARQPEAISLSTMIHFRNLKDNL